MINPWGFLITRLITAALSGASDRLSLSIVNQILVVNLLDMSSIRLSRGIFSEYDYHMCAV